MILRRLGNKKKIAKKIQSYFPPHKIYIEPFFGAGGMFFNKTKTKYNYLNDFDNDVFNLFMTIKEKQPELSKWIELMPVHETLFKHWKDNPEDSDIWKAIRFLMLSNWGFLGIARTMTHQAGRMPKKVIISRIEETLKFVGDSDFLSFDFRILFTKISLSEKDKDNTFTYSDPPYLDADRQQNYAYKIEKWTEKDVVDCFDVTFNSGVKGAISEFNHPFILSEAKKRNLNIITIGERHNLRNTKTEILITNYVNNPSLFDGIL